MRYALAQYSDGNFLIVSEHGENLDAAIMAWHAQCRSLRGDSDVNVYNCSVINEKFEAVGDYTEFLDRTPAPEPEPPVE